MAGGSLSSLIPPTHITIHRELEPFPRGTISVFDGAGRPLGRLRPAGTGFRSLLLEFDWEDGNGNRLFHLDRRRGIGAPRGSQGWALTGPGGELRGAIVRPSWWTMAYELRSGDRSPLRVSVSMWTPGRIVVSRGERRLAVGRRQGWYGRGPTVIQPIRMELAPLALSESATPEMLVLLAFTLLLT